MGHLGISNAVAPATLTFPMGHAIRILDARRPGGVPGQVLPALFSPHRRALQWNADGVAGI